MSATLFALDTPPAPSKASTSTPPARTRYAQRDLPHVHVQFTFRVTRDGRTIATQISPGERAPWESPRRTFVPSSFEVPSTAQWARWCEQQERAPALREQAYAQRFEPSPYDLERWAIERAEWAELREQQERTRREAMRRYDEMLARHEQASLLGTRGALWTEGGAG